MKISVIGSGYVGLVTGTCFAETGNKVICMDVDEQKVQKMKSGIVPIYEPGLEELLRKNIKEHRLSFSTSLRDAVDHADIIFLALPTPQGGDGAADLSFVLQVAGDIAPMIDRYKVIINKSTVPVGTAEKVTKILRKIVDPSLFDVVSNPEFLREGKAVEDFLRPDRVVVGTRSDKAIQLLRELYQPFISEQCPLLIMDEKSAELTKYAANSFLALKISFMNEIANLSEILGADVDQVRTGIGADARIGNMFLFPGVGYGGSCFPKDVEALNNTSVSNRYDFKLIKAVIDVNERQKAVFAQKILDYFNGDLSGRKIALWGLAFKPDTDDIRKAPALEIIEILLEKGAEITAYDPEAIQNVKQLWGENKIKFGSDPYEITKDADALAIVTEWDVFRHADLNKIKSMLKNPVIFDGRNIYDKEELKKLGFYYNSIGRATIE